MIRRMVGLLAVGAFALGCNVETAGEDAASVTQAALPQTLQLARFDAGGNWWIDTNNNRAQDAGDTTFKFGQVGDIPLTGRWNFDTSCANPGAQQVGVFRPSTGQFILDKNNNRVEEASERFHGITPSSLWNYIPVVFRTGVNFKGCRAVFGVVQVPTTSNPQWHANPPLLPVWYVDRNGNDKLDALSVEPSFAYGRQGDTFTTILVGNRSVAAVKRTEGSDSWWYIDFNGNNAWNGCDLDQCGQFGTGTWRALTNPESKHIGVNDNTTSYIDTNNNRFWDGEVTDGLLAHPLSSPATSQALYIARFPLDP